MAGQGNHEPAAQPQKQPLPPPPLPARLLDLRPLVAAGTVVWMAVFVVLVATGSESAWKWTSLAGWVLGLIGLPLMWWQRAASRRGNRGAQRGL